MTKKKNEAEKEKDKPKTLPAEDKLILFEAVEANNTPNYIIMGALSLAGLLQQYQKESEIYGIEDIEPSITVTELDKIIKKFIGE